MSNTVNNLLALVALFFLWGLGARLDESSDFPLEASQQAADEMPPKRELHLVCVAETVQTQAAPSMRQHAPRLQLVSSFAHSDDEALARTAVLRCFINND